MKDAMTKLKQQATDLAARAAADAEEASQYRAQAEREYNSIAAELEQERQQVRLHVLLALVLLPVLLIACTAGASCVIDGRHRAPCVHNDYSPHAEADTAAGESAYSV
jgi:hypothetical protein